MGLRKAMIAPIHLSLNSRAPTSYAVCNMPANSVDPCSVMLLFFMGGSRPTYIGLMVSFTGGLQHDVFCAPECLDQNWVTPFPYIISIKLDLLSGSGRCESNI